MDALDWKLVSRVYTRMLQGTPTGESLRISAKYFFKVYKYEKNEKKKTGFLESTRRYSEIV